MQAQLIKYTDKNFRAFGFNLILVASDSRIESIHNLRLNVKKIRTLLKVIDYKQNVKNNDKTVKALNNIFTYSGSLRDTQIQIQLLKTFKEQAENQFSKIIQALKVEQKKENRRLKNVIIRLNPFDIVLLSQRIEQSIEKQSDESLMLILQKKAERLKMEFVHELKEDIDENSLHRMRIVLKEYINILNLLKKGTGINLLDIINYKKLDILQRQIGEWHDLKLLHVYIVNHGFNASTLIGIIKNEKDKLHIEVKENLLKTRI